MTTADLCAAFAVGESTVHAKARVIEKTLRTGAFDLKCALPSLVDSNPLVWIAEVNGLLIDLRTMPREVQEVAFAKGIIPYIPADGQDDRDPRSQGAQHGGRSVSQAPEKESPKGIAGMADCDDCLLWPEPASSDKDRCRHRAIRECRGRRVTRLDRGSWRRSWRFRHCPRDSWIYRRASGEIHRDQRWHNWLS